MSSWTKAGNIATLSNVNVRGQVMRRGQMTEIDGYLSGRIMVGYGSKPHYVETNLTDGSVIAMNLDTYKGLIGATNYLTAGSAVRDVFTEANKAALTETIKAESKAPTQRAATVTTRASKITGLTVKVKGLTITGLTFEQVQALMGSKTPQTRQVTPKAESTITLENLKALLG